MKSLRESKKDGAKRLDNFSLVAGQWLQHLTALAG